MTLLNCADEVILPDGTAVEAVYQGSALIWPDPAFECLPPVPSAPTMTDWRPIGPDRELGVSFIMPSEPDVDSFRVEYTDAAGAWVLDGPLVGATPGETIVNHSVFFADDPGGAVKRLDYVRVVVFDSFDQSVVGEEGYWQTANGLGLPIQGMGHWRQDEYGYQSGTPTRMYQGYFDTPSFEYSSYTCYGTGIRDLVVADNTWGPPERHVTSMQYNLTREGGGNNNADDVFIGTHDLEDMPAVGSSGDMAEMFDVEVLGTLVYDENKQFELTQTQIDTLVSGEHVGVGIYSEDGKPYMYMLENPDLTGLGVGLLIVHLWG